MIEMNRLSKETSPYLLQHASNPVHWYAWCDEAFERAKKENKLVLVSIGYSACHWCHVMEHEVFENEKAAEFMNRHFINIKVDREERPDIDNVYMLAVQLMTQRGGWPLNCFTLPDGRPVYGGTYFPLAQWMNLLENLVEVKKREPERFEEYASRLKSGIARLDFIPQSSDTDNVNREWLREQVRKWSVQWDPVHGGHNRAPKFPMPVQLDMLLCFVVLEKKHIGTDNENLVAKGLDHLHLTLTKMALGGIYDHAGGGFARYSVDDHWKVPHFEKMLYDNAQLVSLYARAYRFSKNPLYLEIVEQTIAFLENEMTSPEFLIYSALDADSEGEEGKFYTWTVDEFKAVVGNDFEFASDYFGINETGEWENGNYILVRSGNEDEIAAKYNLSESHLKIKIGEVRNKLLEVRNKRIKPGLDNKCLCSWNALAVTAYIDAYKATGNKSYFLQAEKIAVAMKNLFMAGDSIMHCRTMGVTHVPGFIDDFVFTSQAYLDLYEAGSGEFWLLESIRITEMVIAKFTEEGSSLGWFNQHEADSLFARKKEWEDNVIPSANSTLALLLARLSAHTSRDDFGSHSQSMIRTVSEQIDSAGAYTGWLKSAMWWAYGSHEIVITGEKAREMTVDFHREFIPNCIVATSTSHSSLPLFLNRIGPHSAIYVCTGSTCLAPVREARLAIEQLQND